MKIRKFKPINGWTKEGIKKQILERNNGKQAIVNSNGTPTCVYETKDNNHCAVGCFIPNGHDGMDYEGNIDDLLREFPNLYRNMPLPETAMYQLQQIHDWIHRENSFPDCVLKYSKTRRAKYSRKSVRKRMINWINDHVEG